MKSPFVCLNKILNFFLCHKSCLSTNFMDYKNLTLLYVQPDNKVKDFFLLFYPQWSSVVDKAPIASPTWRKSHTPNSSMLQFESFTLYSYTIRVHGGYSLVLPIVIFVIITSALYKKIFTQIDTSNTKLGCHAH